MDNSSSYLLKRLLTINSIKVDQKELEFQLESHPSYPSLHSLTGVLSHFKVDNLAIEVPKDSETLSSLPNSFIAHINNENEEHFALVVQTENQIEITYDKKNKKILSVDEFFQAWSGIIVAVEKTGDEIQEIGKAKFLRKAFYYIAAFGILGLFFWSQPSLFQTLHFLMSLLGIAISILIVQHELGLRSKSLEKICSGKSEKTSCDEVLNSKGAKILGSIKLSDIGLVYFASLSLAWILLSVFPNTNEIFIIIIMSASAVPFTFISIYYQFNVVKKWCPLCLSIVSVLWIQALSLLLSPFQISSFSIDLYSIIIIGSSFMAVISLWIFILPKLILDQEHRSLKIDHHRFKNNYNIFEALLSSNQVVDTAIENSSEIVLGNKSNQALLKICIITNPLCGHCKSAHKAIEPLLKSNNKNIQVRIRLSVNTKDKDSLDVKIGMCLLNIYHKEKEEIAIQALHDLYADTTSIEWLKKWDVDENELYLEELKKEAAWCLKNKINFTPEILINGRSFPNEYDRNDITIFVEDLIDSEQQKIEVLSPELEFAT